MNVTSTHPKLNKESAERNECSSKNDSTAKKKKGKQIKLEINSPKSIMIKRKL